ncbi:MAG: nuclease-related domain-containing protein [Brasilonema sp.]
MDVPKAGRRIRQLARKRRSGALALFGGVFSLVVSPFLILLLIPITSGLGMLVVVGCWVGAALLYQQGQQLWIKANQADQGAQGEEEVARLLKPLECQGWKIEYNVPLKRWGDADVFLHSPKSNYFVVDVKSNKGRVFFDGAMLKRRYGKQVHDFNNGKDLLQAVKGQASVLKDMKGVRVVQPIICFTQANLEKIDQNNQINGVHVVDTVNLLRLLKSA